MNKVNITRLLKHAKIKVNKHSPEILTGLGVAGFITTVIFAVKATPKATELIQERKEELGTDKLKPIETVKTTWKCYIPAVATGIASVSCIIGSNKVNIKRNTALAAACKLSESALTEYKDSVLETVGVEKEKEITDKVNESKVLKNALTDENITCTRDGDILFFEPLTSRYLRSSSNAIEKAENSINSDLRIYDYISLNEWFSQIGLNDSDVGETLGWHIDRTGSLDVDITKSFVTQTGEPAVIIRYLTPPIYDFDMVYPD